MTWDDLTLKEQMEHADACPNLCDLCDGRRSFGMCTSCGGDSEETGEYDLSRCCGSRVIFDSPSEDNYAALRAA